MLACSVPFYRIRNHFYSLRYTTKLHLIYQIISFPQFMRISPVAPIMDWSKSHPRSAGVAWNNSPSGYEIDGHNRNDQDDQQRVQCPFPAGLSKCLGSFHIQIIFPRPGLADHLPPDQPPEHARVPAAHLLQPLGGIRRNRSGFLEAPEILVLFGNDKCCTHLFLFSQPACANPRLTRRACSQAAKSLGGC